MPTYGQFSGVHDTSPESLTLLNDQLRWLYKMVQGGIGLKELSSSLSGVINGHSSSITQQAEQIELKVSTETYDLEKVYRGTTAPSDPATDTLWLDTSLDPYILKKWSGSAWIVAGASVVKSSAVTIKDDEVTIRTFQFSVVITDETDTEVTRVSVDENGVSAEKVNAESLYAGPVYLNDEVPSLLGSPALRLPPGTYEIFVHPAQNTGNPNWDGGKKTLQEAVDCLPKWFDGADVKIYTYPDAVYEDCTVQGIYGHGSLYIGPYPDAVFPCNAGTIIVSNCMISVSLDYLHLVYLYIANAWRVKYNHGIINGGNTGIMILGGSKVYVLNSEVNAYHGFWVAEMSHLYISAIVGDCTYSIVAREGALIQSDNTIPYSTSGQSIGSSQAWGTFTATHGGGAVTPPDPEVLTTQFNLVSSRTWRETQWYSSGADNMVGYGEFENYGEQTGCMWFDLSSLAGKTVLSARLRVYRQPSAGSSSAESITVYRISAPASRPGGSWTTTNSPTRAGAGATTAAVPRGVATWIAVLASDVQNIIASGYGLALFTGSTGYGRCDGYGATTPPILEVTYE